MLLPVPTIAATDEMFTITASPEPLHQRCEGSDGREGPADISGEDGVDQVVGQGFQVVGAGSCG